MTDKPLYVPVEVHIRRTETGEVRIYRDNLYTTVDYDGIFIWAEGNWSCDCNRAIFFAEAGGEQNKSNQCGEYGYIVDRIVRVADGELLYTEAPGEFEPGIPADFEERKIH